MKKTLCIYAGAYNYWGDFDPKRLTSVSGGQIGGGETAAMMTAIEMRRAGWDVYIGANTGKTRYIEGITIIPADDVYPVFCALNPDVLLSWDASYLFRYNIPAKIRVLAFQLNNTEVGVYDTVIDYYFHPSEWHRQRFHKEYGVPLKKSIADMTNATDPSLFYQAERTRSVVYCSSPDRGLHHLLEMWPAIYKEYNDAQLHIYYDISKWMGIVNTARNKGRILNTTDRADAIQTNLSRLTNHNVYLHGGVSKPILYRALAEASVVAYPCDPVAPTEGYSMTILDAWAAGCEVVTTDADALSELWGGKEGITILPLPVDNKTFSDSIIDKLKVLPPAWPRNIPNHYTWSGLATRWDTLFTNILMEATNERG